MVFILFSIFPNSYTNTKTLSRKTPLGGLLLTLVSEIATYLKEHYHRPSMLGENKNFQRISEVPFVNHIYEFIRFYERHKLFCDEVSGIMERILVEDGKEKKFKIGISNFSFGIKRLNAFVMDNLHYIKEVDEMRKIEGRVADLEERFSNDDEYHKLSKLGTRNAESEVLLYKKYLSYLFECYDIGNLLYTLLQTSLMMGTKDVKKAVSYHNDTSFFEKLSRYRDEVSDDLANFKLRNMFEHLKRIAGYYYTYKIFISNTDAFAIDCIMENLVDYCLDQDITRLVVKMKDKQKLSLTELELGKVETGRIKRVLMKVYYITNKSLSSKNILPKIQKRINIDRTLI